MPAGNSKKGRCTTSSPPASGYSDPICAWGQKRRYARSRFILQNKNFCPRAARGMLVQRVTRLPAQKGVFSFAKENTPFTPCSAVGLHFPLYLCEEKRAASRKRDSSFFFTSAGSARRCAQRLHRSTSYRCRGRDHSRLARPRCARCSSRSICGAACPSCG